ncbi:hypothetical protein [Stieleria varia]|uniref:Uncharacterized protein n=1 Tax=Stieleria varia TaxID=2528005 RepID=A0A5C6AH35_9BACT|nr:hypothetical protein [Stieleria varia]TWT98381.1 hypothetical protein Pla52n_48940 [Stieleria varia]
MRTRQFIFALLAAFACTTIHAQDLGYKHRPIPDFVLRLADEHIKNLPDNPDGFGAQRRAFASMFLWAYTGFSPEHMDLEKYPEFAGLNAGIDYRKRNPAATHEVLSGFGYELTKRTGNWLTGSEISAFYEPKNQSPRDSWWLSTLDECKTNHIRWEPLPMPQFEREVDDKIARRLESIRGRIARVKVIGYLSPEGKYGHLGLYEREFLAIEITDVARRRDGNRTTDISSTGDGYRSYDGQPYPSEETNEP